MYACMTAPATMIVHGAPQGSVLGPIRFIMYTADILCIVKGHHLMCFCYAEDTQLYFHMKIDKFPAVKGMVEDCISHVPRWLASNRLKLNPGKTEVMWCSSVRRASTFDHPSLTIGPSTISPLNVVRDLGVQLRADLSITDQVGKVVRSCYYNIQQLRSIRSALTPYVIWLTH